MVTSGIDRGIIIVPSIESALAFYRDTVGLQVAAQGSLDRAALEKLWGLPPGSSGRTVCLRNGKQLTALELVQLTPSPQTAVRDRAATNDFGLFDVTFYVSDALKLGEKLKAQGRKFLTEPMRNPPSGTGNEVIEGFAYGPAKEIVGILEYVKPPAAEDKRLPGDFWIMMDMAQVVESMDRAIDFYQNALGLKVMFDFTPPTGFLDGIFHLKDSKCRVVWFNKADFQGPAVESIEISIKGKPINPSPQELGIFMLAFETADLDAEIKTIISKGYKVIAAPLKTRNSLHGDIRVAHIEGPDKIRIELFEKVK